MLPCRFVAVRMQPRCLWFCGPGGHCLVLTRATEKHTITQHNFTISYGDPSPRLPTRDSHLTLARVPGSPCLPLGSWLMSPALAELGNSMLRPGGVFASVVRFFHPGLSNCLPLWKMPFYSSLISFSFTLFSLQGFLIAGPWTAWIEAPVFSPLLLSTCIFCSAF